MTQPSPSPGPPARVPDPGVRPPGAAPTPSPSPGPKPGTATDYPNQGDPAPGQPGFIDKAIDAITPDALTDVPDGIRAVRAWISDRHNWVRVAWFLSGAAMFTVGLVMVGQRPLAAGINQVTKPVGSVVKSVYK